MWAKNSGFSTESDISKAAVEEAKTSQQSPQSPKPSILLLNPEFHPLYHAP
jgi:hypothetical protein